MQHLSSLLVLLVGTSLVLSSCQYPYGYGYNSTGPYAGTFIPYRYTGRNPIGDLSSSALGTNRDRYYYVIRGTGAGQRYYGIRTVHHSPNSRPAGLYPRSYYMHPYYSNRSYSSPYYSRSSSSMNSMTNRPWGGSYGYGVPYSQPHNWGSGLGLGSIWF